MFWMYFLKNSWFYYGLKALNRCINKIRRSAVYWSAVDRSAVNRPAVRYLDVGGSAVGGLNDWSR